MFKVLSSFSALTFLGLTVKDWNFSGLAKRELFLYQDDAKWPCVLSPDSTVLRVSPSAYSWWSSAYMMRVGTVVIRHVILKHIPQKRPNAVPWGQPRVIVFHSLVWPFIFTLLNILSKKDRVKSNEQLLKPQASSFFMVSAGHKESNALLIFVDKMVTSSFLSTACFHSSTRVSRVTSRLYFFL